MGPQRNHGLRFGVGSSRWTTQGDARTGWGRVGAAVALVVGGLAVTAALPAPASALPNVVSGLGFDQYLAFGSAAGVPVQAVAVAFEPAGTGLFAADKQGRIVHYAGPGDTAPVVTLDARAKVHDALDRGLVGLALDPDFAASGGGSRFVYFTYTYDKDPFGDGTVPAWGGAAGNDSCGGGQGAVFGGCTVTDRLSRIHVNAAGVADGAEQVLLENDGSSGFCNQFLSHSIDSVGFGPDGLLYVSAGDGASFSNNDWGQLATRPDGVVNPCNDAPGYRGNALSAPTAEGGVLRAQAMRTKYPADGYTPLDGTIMRINKDGSIPAANPLVGNGIPGDDRVIAFGARNPFRFTWRPGTNELWTGLVGNGTWESIQRFVPSSSAVPNFGWPCYEGASTATSNTTQFNLCTSLTGAPEAIGTKSGVAQLHLPWFQYDHQNPANVAEGCKGTSAGSSITGGTFVQSPNWPVAFQGKYLFGDYGRQCLWLVDPDSVSPSRTWIASNIGPTQIVTGPDGNVYVVDLGASGGFLWRFGTGPTPRLSVSQRGGAVGPGGAVALNVPVDLNASATTFVLANAVSYEWDLDGNGSYETSTGTGTATSRTFTVPGPVRLGLKVTDTNGKVAFTSALVQAGTPPAISAFSVGGEPWAVGDTIAYSAVATDAYGSALHYRWDVAVRHCDPAAATSDCHEHLNIVGGLPDAPSGSFTAPDHEWRAFLHVSLTVSDDYGLTASGDAVIAAAGVPVSVATRPSGLQVGVAEVAGTSPVSVTRVAGGRVQLSVPTTQTLGGTELVFTGWDDAPLAPADRALEPRAATELVANFAPSGGFTPLGPTRVLDTRDGTGAPAGRIPAGGTVAVSLAAAGVPAGASGVILNVTATESASGGFVTAYPCDVARPFSSSVNLTPGVDVANLGQVRVSASGTVCLFSSAPTHLVADLAGYVSATGTPFTPVTPERLVDTRVALGGRQGPVGPDAAIEIDLSGVAPAGARAVVLNVTATDAAAAGFVTAYPCGARPLASNLNVPRGDTRPNLVVVPLSAARSVCLYTQSSANLLADLAGWYAPGGGRIVTQQPRRVMDTRENVGAAPLQSRIPVTLELGRYAPAGATAVVLNLTSVEPQADGFVTAYPCGDLPVVSSLNVPPRDTRPNLVMVPLGPGGVVCLYSQSPTNLVADVAGWVR